MWYHEYLLHSDRISILFSSLRHLYRTRKVTICRYRRTCVRQKHQVNPFSCLNSHFSQTDWSLLGQRKLNVAYQLLTCSDDGIWMREDLEGNRFVYPMQLQCASDDAQETFDYFVTNNGAIWICKSHFSEKHDILSIYLCLWTINCRE